MGTGLGLPFFLGTGTASVCERCWRRGGAVLLDRLVVAPGGGDAEFVDAGRHEHAQPMEDVN